MVMIPSFDTERLTRGLEHGNSFSSFFFSLGHSQSLLAVRVPCLVGVEIAVGVLVADACREAGSNAVKGVVNGRETGRGALVRDLLANLVESREGVRKNESSWRLSASSHMDLWRVVACFVAVRVPVASRPRPRPETPWAGFVD